MDAITLDGDVAELNLERCVGCGVCVHHCPAEAITLAKRSDFMEPPRSFRELMMKQAEARMKSQ
jgi:Fe-S-cluster-containing hydrogenase component 2